MTAAASPRHHNADAPRQPVRSLHDKHGVVVIRPLIGLSRVRWKQVSMDADIDIFFCDPHAPWQRATNENNGLLRQYFRRAATCPSTLPPTWTGLPPNSTTHHAND